MASSSCSSFYCCYSASIPKLPSSSCFSFPSYPFNLSGSNGISLHRALSNSRIFAKFEKFQDETPQDSLEEPITSSSSSASLESEQQTIQAEEEDDSCLPSDLEGAVRQSSQASATFVSSGGMRAIVELLIPQLQFLDDEGAQGELWELSRIFIDTLIEETGCERVKAIFPDAGAAALLKYRWQDAAFSFSSLSDRKPVGSEDEIVVMVVPDYQMLEYVQRITSELSDDPIMFPGFHWKLLSLIYFIFTFTVVYSMRPLPSGAVFRCYPGLWKVFYDDQDRPNRYLLAKEQISRPVAEELEIIYGDIDEMSEKGPSIFDRAAGIFSSINRFMKVISR
ncbi:hypothetical protein TEA_029767 [Camellia sinensis var. sinensis]|uniref:DUF1995 domain-containing protein n=1 Tax=Camellia sinensis var. sinensis TaxID=542762 RepID=A0A4V3WKN7_CAMSN|nr:hypothetical protein TEA_029767 [Camellia sinensis var. sinensis]